MAPLQYDFNQVTNFSGTLFLSFSNMKGYAVYMIPIPFVPIKTQRYLKQMLVFLVSENGTTHFLMQKSRSPHSHLQSTFLTDSTSLINKVHIFHFLLPLLLLFSNQSHLLETIFMLLLGSCLKNNLKAHCTSQVATLSIRLLYSVTEPCFLSNEITVVPTPLAERELSLL
jgi:hypothetical protein